MPLPAAIPLISAGLSGAGTIFSAIKGGQATQEQNRLLKEQEEKNEAFYNKGQNFMETNLAKGVLERAREKYREDAKTAESKAEVTGASPEAEIAEKTARGKEYSDVVRNLAEAGTRYTQGQEYQYQNNLHRLLGLRMQLQQQKAESAANVAGNAGDLIGSTAMLSGFGGGSTSVPISGAESGIKKPEPYRGVSLSN